MVFADRWCIICSDIHMQRPSVLDRIYRLKVLASATLLVIVGLLLSALGDWMSEKATAHLLVATVQGLADVLVVSGGIGLAIDFFTGREKAEAEVERTRAVVKELVPDMTDAVLRGLVVGRDDLRRVANPALLDSIATNALALRLGDDGFATQIYQGLLAQAIHTSERWEDVDVNVRLACVSKATAKAAPLLDAQLLYIVIISWEYTVALSDRIRRFAATDDPDEFREFLNDGPANSAWYIPEGSIDPASRVAFEVLSYSIDGVELPIRRTTRKHGQTYSIDVGAEVIAAKRPVRVRQVYRTVVQRTGHRFRLALTQPSHGMRLVLDYTDADIATLRVGEFVSSATPAQVRFLPEGAPAKQVEVSVPGWLLPQAEVTCVWTLQDEMPRRHRTAGRASAGPVA